MNLQPGSIESPTAADEGAPRWVRIAAVLREDIVSGRLPPGARLPNEVELASRFAVHRHTLRQAVRQLVLEGHLHVQQGRGTFVRALALDYVLQRRTRMTENLAEAGERARRELLRAERLPAGPWAAPLRLRPDAPVELLHTRTTVRGLPIGLTVSAYPSKRLGGVADAFRATGSVTAALKRLGVGDYQRARSTISSRLPTPAEADTLARPSTEPVLVVQYVSIDRDGVPVEAGHTLFAADAVQLSVDHAA